jgi:hypothetical protein
MWTDCRPAGGDASRSAPLIGGVNRGVAGPAKITFFLMLLLVGVRRVALMTRTDRPSMLAEPAAA